jgi:hypothetical protein
MTVALSAQAGEWNLIMTLYTIMNLPNDRRVHPMLLPQSVLKLSVVWDSRARYMTHVRFLTTTSEISDPIAGSSLLNIHCSYSVERLVRSLVVGFHSIRRHERKAVRYRDVSHVTSLPTAQNPGKRGPKPRGRTTGRKRVQPASPPGSRSAIYEGVSLHFKESIQCRIQVSRCPLPHTQSS